MASVYDLKPAFQNLLRPVMGRLARAGVTPNAITLAALMGSIVVGLALWQARRQPAWLLCLPLWLFVRMALNAIDGMMARELKMATDLGQVLNELGDVISDLALYLPLAFLQSNAGWSVVAFGFGAALTEFSGVLAHSMGACRRYDGPMGKSDRAFVVGALALATFLFPAVWRAWPWVFGIAALLTAVTCWNRLARALAELRSARRKPAAT